MGQQLSTQNFPPKILFAALDLTKRKVSHKVRQEERMHVNFLILPSESRAELWANRVNSCQQTVHSMPQMECCLPLEGVELLSVQIRAARWDWSGQCRGGRNILPFCITPNPVRASVCADSPLLFLQWVESRESSGLPSPDDIDKQWGQPPGPPLYSRGWSGLQQAQSSKMRWLRKRGGSYVL